MGINIEVIPQREVILEINSNPIPIKGENGLSTYELAVKNGFVGTESEWLESLKVKTTWSSTDW